MKEYKIIVMKQKLDKNKSEAWKKRKEENYGKTPQLNPNNKKSYII